MPPKLESLFHPKKKAKPQGQRPPSSTPPRLKRKLPHEKSVNDDDEDELKLPDTPFQEFRLLSSALNGWKYDVMRFDSRKPVDIYRWHQPVKLNRKDLRRNDEVAMTSTPQAIGPMVGPDGKPVIGPDGKVVMIDADGRPIQPTNGNASEVPQGKDKDKGKVTKKRFQKKTRQVFPVAEETRQLRREERCPWVIEDSSPNHNEVWVAQMEDLGKAETHAFFMPAANEVFKFVPSHRWYKFQKKLRHDLPTDLPNVESLYNMNQKRDPQQWLAIRKGKAPSAATAAMFKAEAEGKDVSVGPSLVVSSGQSLGPGGRKLKAVDSGMDYLFDEGEDGEGVRKRRQKELGEEGDMDEQVYEEDFADDDEHVEADENDEEAKEAEERIKKEYRTANKQRDTGLDATDDEEEAPTMSKQAKAMQKLIRNREGNDAYDSDEEKNPYASSEEEDEEPVVLPTATAAIQEQQQKIESSAQTPKPGPALGRPPAPATASVTGSRATSPSLSPGHGGHSVVAKRATSPHVPKPRAPTMPHGNKLPGGHRHMAQSRSTSPAGVDGANGVTPKGTLKRKADSPTSPGPGSPVGDSQTPKQKKRKAAVNDPSVSSADLESMLLEWLKTTTDASTRDCIQHFTPYLVDAEKKTEFSAMVRKHAALKNGSLVVRTGIRGGSSAPSPPAA